MKYKNETILTYKGRRVRVYQGGKYIYWAEIIDNNGNVIPRSITYDGRTSAEAFEKMQAGIDRVDHYNG